MIIFLEKKRNCNFYISVYLKYIYESLIQILNFRNCPFYPINDLFQELIHVISVLEYFEKKKKRI